jgi:hypothetical protein
MQTDNLAKWLFNHSGPILRHRVAVEWMGISGREKERLLQESLATTEVQGWLRLLREAKAIHGSTDAHAENALGKLLEYGFDRNVPALDECACHLLRIPLGRWDALVLMPFLLRAGYGEEPPVRDWFVERVEKLHATACLSSYDFFLGEDETARVPKAWREKPIYRDEFGHAAGYALPTCYDLYALAYVREFPAITDYPEKRERIAAFLGDTRFQSIRDGYGWDKENRRCYSAGRVFLACATRERLVLFADLGSRIKAARESAWFREAVEELEKYRSAEGRYLFPASLLKEREGYHLYAGCHMGLGEERRRGLGLELESTFWMMRIAPTPGYCAIFPCCVIIPTSH